MPKIIIQIPCFNEEKTLPLVLQDFPENIEIVIIDDGSTDETVKIATQFDAAILKHEKNLGLGMAFKTGLEYAISQNADILINTDADNQYPGKYIPDLINQILENKADVVIGNRKPWKIKEFSFLKRVLQFSGSVLVQALLGAKIPDPVSGFRAYNKKAMQSLKITTKFSYTLQSLAQLVSNKCKIISVPITTNAQTRPSRLFKSIGHFIFKSGWIIASKFLKYTLGGAIAYLLRIGVTSFFTEILNFYYFHSYLIALACVLIFGFYYSKYITFKARGKAWTYLCFWFAFYILDASLVKFATEILSWHYLVSISIIALIIFFAKYFIWDKLIFKYGR